MSSVGWLARPVRSVCAPLLRALYNAKVSGLENVPVEGPAILAPNHQSFFDTPLLMLIAPRPVVFLGKAEYMDDWKTRHFFPAIGMVPIARDKARSSMAALTTAADLLRQSALVGIYPEGTRCRDGKLHRGHTGVAHLSVMTGAPIVPVGLTGTSVVQPVGQSLPHIRGRVSVQFGEPIWPAQYRAGGRRSRRNHLTNDVMASIASMTDQERSPDFSSNEPPLVRGGSESVYRVRRLQGSAADWKQATAAVVDSACYRWDDARVGQVGALRCRVGVDGTVDYEIELKISTRFRSSDDD